ncbi:BZ3500_MvSof-1268-A1-R1_Chr2-3g05376 [Microbotryum saponariae]|uniref:BZ3500_MvSof-1268-A1-R1_Chr2-3g05376 protein n=1 Tax=Microbotryum saponariae TaxID=289078 RepID=A0A2X0LQ89_9BASI|nr:BZ3500_MvSof-1268-A1-R1_Chr2-3g05376 [Microbotryum saponariae]SDA01313.1 BZ3501_MvSof-1269-A2-R1_Chr2-2g05049 [Microbotryum saponariae]
MCLEATCENCNQLTWACSTKRASLLTTYECLDLPYQWPGYVHRWGCGGHIASVMDKIPDGKQCKCDQPGGPGAKPRKPSTAPAGKVDVHYKGPQE